VTHVNLAPRLGLEPWTCGLTVGRVGTEKISRLFNGLNSVGTLFAAYSKANASQKYAVNMKCSLHIM